MAATTVTDTRAFDPAAWLARGEAMGFRVLPAAIPTPGSIYREEPVGRRPPLDMELAWHRECRDHHATIYAWLAERFEIIGR